MSDDLTEDLTPGGEPPPPPAPPPAPAGAPGTARRGLDALVRPQHDRDVDRHRDLAADRVPAPVGDGVRDRHHRDEAGRRLQRREHHAEHPVRARARRDPDLGRGPRGRRMDAGARSRGGVGRRPAPVHDRDRGALGDRAPGHRPGAVDRRPLHRRLPRRPTRGRARARHVLPALVHAAGRLLRDRRRRGRPAERAPAVRRADVRADREQRDRDRDVPDLRRDAGPGGARTSSRPARSSSSSRSGRRSAWWR